MLVHRLAYRFHRATGWRFTDAHPYPRPEPLFDPGRLVLSDGVQAVIGRRKPHGHTIDLFGFQVAERLSARHVGGNWGEYGDEFFKRNNANLSAGAGELVSCYDLRPLFYPDGPGPIESWGHDRIWFVTSADRTETLICWRPPLA